MSPTPATLTRPHASGRFRPSNPGGPGKPYARQAALLRRAAARVVTEADAEEVMRVFLTKAKAGDMAAAKFVVRAAKRPPTVPTIRPHADEA